MRILILGGVAEAKTLAEKLIECGHRIIYSLVGLVRQPDLPCEIHVGGFSALSNDMVTDNDQRGVLGLTQYCVQRRIELLLDATHPYAAVISAHAVQAAKQAAIPCWRLNRPGWNPADYPNWHSYNDWNDLLPQIIRYNRPFFSIGVSALKWADRRPEHQQWVVRSARPFPKNSGIIPLIAIGPFDYQAEHSLMLKYQIDALVSKNSGCQRVAHKLDVALALNIPLFVQTRPPLLAAERCFEQVDGIVNSIVKGIFKALPDNSF